MRYLLILSFLVLLAACQLTNSQTMDVGTSGSEASASARQDQVILENRTGEALVYDLFPARAARPLRQTFTLDLSALPPTSVEADSSAALFDCQNPSAQKGATLYLYRITATTEKEAMAELATSISITDVFLTDLPSRNCAIVINKL